MKVNRRPFVLAVAGTLVLALTVVGLTAPTVGASARAKVKTVKICDVSDFSGVQGAGGPTGFNGGRIAADIVNASGGIKSLGGAKLMVQKFDTQSNPDLGPPEAIAAVAGKCKAIFGGTISDTVIAESSITNRAGIPLISLATADALIQRGYSDVFLMNTTSGLALNYYNMMKFVASSLNIAHPTVGVSINDSTFGAEFYAAWQALNNASHEFNVVSNVSYPPTTTDFSTIALSMTSSKPDILFNAGYPNDAVALQGLFKTSIPTTAQAFLSTAVDSLTVSQLGPQADGQIFGDKSAPPSNSAALKKFNSLYQSKTGSAPSLSAWVSYSAVMMFARALEKAGSTNGAKISTALHQVTLTAANGNVFPLSVHFGENGVLTNQPWFWLQDQGGQLKYVFPTAIKQAALQPYSG